MVASGNDGAWTARAAPGSRRHAGLLFAGDEALEPLARGVVRPLLGRRFHEIGRRRQEGALQPAIQREAAAPDGVDDDAGGVRRVTDLELQLDVDGLVAERATLEADVRPLAVLEPRHVIAGTAVDGVGRQLVSELRAHGVRLADLLGGEPLRSEEHTSELQSQSNL